MTTSTPDHIVHCGVSMHVDAVAKVMASTAPKGPLVLNAPVVPSCVDIKPDGGGVVALPSAKPGLLKRLFGGG